MSEKVSKEQSDSWRLDSNNWKWGVFYFNKEDKRLLPPKRNKLLGWTVNFANPWSLVVFVVLLTAVIIISKLIVNL